MMQQDQHQEQQQRQQPLALNSNIFVATAPVQNQLIATILDADISLADKLLRVTSLLRHISNCDVINSMAMQDGSGIAPGSFPLLLAVSVGEGELVELLVREGADVNKAVEGEYWEDAVCPTSLHQACLDGRLDLVQILMPNSTVMCLETANHRGQTPYHLAVESGNIDLVGYLAEKGFSTDACDLRGNNALHMACTALPEVELLEEEHDHTDSNHNSVQSAPYHSPSTVDQDSTRTPQACCMVAVLLNHGVSVYKRNRIGLTPIRLAALMGKQASARLMLKHYVNGARSGVENQADVEGEGRAPIADRYVETRGLLRRLGLHPLEAAVSERNWTRMRTVLEMLRGAGSGKKNGKEKRISDVKVCAADERRLKDGCVFEGDREEEQSAKSGDGESEFKLRQREQSVPGGVHDFEHPPSLAYSILQPVSPLTQPAREWLQNTVHEGRLDGQWWGEGETAVADESLHMVVLNPQLNKILKLLLDSTLVQHSINGNSSLGFTPLYSACTNRNPIAVSLLLAAGADPDKPSQRRHVRPLKKSILLNDLVTSRLLLQAGASACHCPRCLRRIFRDGGRRGRAVGRVGGKWEESGQVGVSLVGLKDEDTDLLHLALFTDPALSRMLIEAGTCVSTKAESIIASTRVNNEEVWQERGVIGEDGRGQTTQSIIIDDVSQDDNIGTFWNMLDTLYDCGWVESVRRLLHLEIAGSSAHRTLHGQTNSAEGQRQPNTTRRQRQQGQEQGQREQERIRRNIRARHPVNNTSGLTLETEPTINGPLPTTIRAELYQLPQIMESDDDEHDDNQDDDNHDDDDSANDYNDDHENEEDRHDHDNDNNNGDRDDDFRHDTSLDSVLYLRWRELLRSPVSLKQTCRTVIRRSLGATVFSSVDRLPIPGIVKRYLTVSY